MSSPAPPSDSCPSDDVLARFATGLLSSEERRTFEAHLSGCGVCFEVVSALLASSSSGTGGQASREPAPVLSRGTAVGRYLVLERSGEGAMGVVYAAYDPELDRKVALKLLRPSGDTSEVAEQRRARLQREARSLARLSHPHVVAVFDVGTRGEQVFIAMEWVDGVTLRQWLAERPRDWREVLEVLRRAGEGLAAAHATGLIHRDFKPDNVLVGRDGRVRVSDFGLARPVDTEPAPPGAATGQGTELTRSGPLAGSPAYMAPEQLKGSAASALSDQFSFCVTLHEALFGERPFAATSLGQASSAVGRNIPGSVRQVLQRGLQVEPGARYPSMAALLEALERPLRRTGRRTAAVVALGVVAAAGLGVPALLRLRNQQRCEAAGALVASTWNAATRDEVGEAFRRTGAPGAETAWERVRRSLEVYTEGWSQARREACEATHVRGEQPEETLALREACLQSALLDLRALSRVLAHADAGVVENAVRATAALPDLASCGDVAVLSRGSTLPGPAVREQVEALQGRVAEARALFQSGQFPRSLKAAEELVPQVRATGFQPLLAETWLVLSASRLKFNTYKEAEEAAHEAIWAAELARDDRLTAWARIQLAMVLSSNMERLELAERWMRHAEVAVERIGRPWDLAYNLENTQGALVQRQGRLREAEGHFRRALALVEGAGRAEGVDATRAVSNVAQVLFAQGKAKEALALVERVTELRLKVLGPEHGDLVSTFNDRAAILSGLERCEESLEWGEKARALARKMLPPEHAFQAGILMNLGSCKGRLGRVDEALADYAEAVQVYVRMHGEEHPDTAEQRYFLAWAMMMAERSQQALPEAEKARRVLERTVGTEHPLFLQALSLEGQLLVSLGEHPRALPLLERAVAAMQGKDVPPNVRADAHFALAQALLRTSSGRARALELARKMYGALLEAGHEQATRDARGWFERNGIPLP
ncbi:serine/threonine protein kinase [Archangium gephyra]|uniref:Serine/threonine protein kinase n=1 Tax=Archangium gephyra TaxID=48 RepID=A0AAC8QDW5_9BACT|nr:tetratricopeptide repeat-containing serine/threonine-protein kinase [Archangium gephyra]AKJ05408.1 putative serine/threonine protein kinase [Archangium gephyra]REG36092.1 serine/threonine protein kinase [Archangium gephyra]